MRRSQRWRELHDQLGEALRDFTSAQGVQYVLGEDSKIDSLYDHLWGMILESAPDEVPLTEDIPEEYIAQIQHDNAIRELIADKVEEERDYLTFKHDKASRRVKTLTYLATPK